MTGTSGATFEVAFENEVATVGFRKIENGAFRVRVEPASGVTLALNASEWKQPNSDGNRYSTIAANGEELASSLVEAGVAIGTASAFQAILKAASVAV